MEAIYITIILNILLAVFVLLGFLWGFGRGLKKSVLRFVFFIVGTVFAILFSGVLTNSLLNIGFEFQGEFATAKQHLISLITSQAEISELYNASPSLQLLISELPKMFVNIIMFVVLLYFFKFISWIFYTSLANVILKKGESLGNFGDTIYTIKKGQPVVLAENPSKKHRIAGGFVSAFQGLVLLFLTLLPISGAVSIFNNITNHAMQMQELNSQFYSESFNLESNSQNSLINSISENNINENENYYIENLINNSSNFNENVSVQNNFLNLENESLPFLSELIEENINSEIFEYTKAYSNGIAPVFFDLLGFQTAFFDSFTSITVANETFSLRNEINTFINTYTNFVTIYNNFDENSLESIDFALLKEAANEVFKSGIVRVVGNEVLNFYLQKQLNQSDFGEFNSQVLTLASIVEESLIGAESGPDVLKQDLITIVDVFEIVIKDGIYSLISETENDEIEIDLIIELLSENNAKIFNNLIENFSQSTTFKKLTVGGLNLLLDMAEEQIYEFNYTEEIRNSGEVQIAKFDRVSYQHINWINFKNELTEIFKNSANLYFLLNDFNEFSFEEILEKSHKIRPLADAMASILNTLQNSTVIKNTVGGENIYNQILDELNSGQYSEYINFQNLKNLNWANEIEPFIRLFNFSLSYIDENSIDFVTFNYNKLESILIELFESETVKAVKLKTLNLILEQLNIEENQDLDLNMLIEKIYNDYENRFEYLNQFKEDFVIILNVMKILGEEEFLNWIFYDIELNWITFANNLNSKDLNNETKADVLIDKLTNLRAFRISFIEWLNYLVLVDIEDENGEVLQIQKTVDWNGWEDFGLELKEIASNLLEILQNTDLEFSENIDSILELENLIKNETSLLNLGKILDILATCEFLEYEIEDISSSIYNVLIQEYLGDIFYITPALTENYIEGFWYNEFLSIYEAIDILNSVIVDNLTQTSLFDEFISGGDFNQHISDAYENGDLNDLQLETVLNAILSSELLKNYSIDLINQVNINLINLFDETYNENIVNLDTDFALQKQDIINVLMSMIKLSGKNLSDITSDFENDNTETKNNLTNLMQSLKINYESEGIFGGVDGTYMRITNFLTDENSDNNFIVAIVTLISNEDENIIGTTPLYNWDEIFNFVGEYLSQL